MAGIAKRQGSGFTLIELIIVIVLLGILSSVALPRFMDLAGSAYTASVKGSSSALAAGINLAHSKYLISPSTTIFGSGSNPDLYFANTTYKYPTSFYVGGVTLTAFTNSGSGAAACAGLWNTVLDAGSATVDTTSTATPAPDYVAASLAVGGLGTNGGCYFAYRDNVRAGLPATSYIFYDSTIGTVAVTSTAP